MAYDEVGPRVDKEKEAFIRQLMWRDFSYQQLYQHKEAETKAMRKNLTDLTGRIIRQKLNDGKKVKRVIHWWMRVCESYMRPAICITVFEWLSPHF